MTLCMSLRKTSMPIIPFFTGPSTKPLLIESLAGAFDNFALTIIPDTELISELHAFGMERLPSGMFRYMASGGGHDDRVMALALAYHGATYGVPTWGAELVEIEPRRDDQPKVIDASYELVPWPTPEWTYQND